MTDNINKYSDGDKLVDDKLKAFLLNSKPMDRTMDLDAIRQRTYQKRHLREVRRAKMIRLSVFSAIAAGLALLFIFSPVSKVLQSVSRSQQIVAEAQQLHTLKVPVGDKLTVVLSDGTRVTANSNTTLTYPRQFVGSKREVSIKGEAYFEVAHDASHPFIVHANGLSVKVLGTKFNVCSYDKSTTDVVLAQGSVEVTMGKQGMVRMKPNQKVTVTNGELTGFGEVNAAEYTSWMDDVLYLHGESLNKIAKRLNNYYGPSIRIAAGGNHRLYGKLALQPDLATVLDCINAIAGTRTVKQNNKFIIEK